MKLHKISLANRLYRILWKITYIVLFRYTPNFFFNWRRIILMIFGAKLDVGVRVYPKVAIWSPKNLIMKKGSCLANDVEVYNVGKVCIGENTVVSQRSYLLTASKDYSSGRRNLLVSDINIKNNVWIAASVTIGPGVTIGNNCVILLGSIIFEDIIDDKKVRGIKNYIISDLK